MNEFGTRQLRGTSGTPKFYYDVSGDNLVAPLDVLQVINFLNSPVGEGEGTRVDLANSMLVPSATPLSVMVDIRQIELVATEIFQRESRCPTLGSMQTVAGLNDVLAAIRVWNHAQDLPLAETPNFDFTSLSDAELDELLTDISLKVGLEQEGVISPIGTE